MRSLLAIIVVCLLLSCNKAQRKTTFYSFEVMSETPITNLVHQSADFGIVHENIQTTYFLKEWRGKNKNDLYISTQTHNGVVRIFKDKKLIAEKYGDYIEVYYQSNP